MFGFAYSLVILAASALAHLLWWRIRVPPSQTSALLGIAMAAWVFGMIGAWHLSTDLTTTQRLGLLLHVSLLQVPVSLAYIALYSMIEHDSPSLLLVRLANSRQGLLLTQVPALLDGPSLIEQRLAAAQGNRLVRAVGNDWQLEPAGRRLAQVFERIVMWFRLDQTG